MNKLYTYKITALIALLIVFVGCKNPGQDIKVVVNMDLMKYSALVHISDETGATPSNISLTMGGASGNDIYEISGKKSFPVKDGIITLGLGPSVNPTSAQDVNFTVTVTAPGYNTLTQPVTFKNGEMQQVVMVMLQKTPTAATTTPSSDASSAPATTTPATGTVTPVTSAPATTTTPTTSTPATTTPVTTTTPATGATTTPVTSTPSTTIPVTTTPVTTKPVTTTPATTTTTPTTSTPATTTPATSTPVTTTPVTTAPVVAAIPVNISLDFTGYCTNRPNLQIRPSLYVFYRLKDSGTAYSYLGFMKDGHLDTKLLFNKVYDFQITYGGVNYTVTGRIEQTSYQSTFDMGTAVCATF